MKKRAVILFTNSPDQDVTLKFANQGVIYKQSALDYLRNAISIYTEIFNSEKFDFLLSAGSEEISEFGYIDKSNIINQTGDSFGCRFRNTLSETFAKGYERIVIVGNDTPGLKLKDVEKALFKTSGQECVIGPSKDGGFYLLSICKNHFDNISSSEFVALPYQTSKVTKSLINLLRKYSIKIHLLKKKGDLDRISDINKYLNEIKYLRLHFSHLIQIALLKISSSFYKKRQIITQFFDHQLFYLKAPPSPAQ